MDKKAIVRIVLGVSFCVNVIIYFILLIISFTQTSMTYNENGITPFEEQNGCLDNSDARKHRPFRYTLKGYDTMFECDWPPGSVVLRCLTCFAALGTIAMIVLWFMKKKKKFLWILFFYILFLGVLALICTIVDSSLLSSGTSWCESDFHDSVLLTKTYNVECHPGKFSSIIVFDVFALIATIVTGTALFFFSFKWGSPGEKKPLLNKDSEGIQEEVEPVKEEPKPEPKPDQKKAENEERVKKSPFYNPDVAKSDTTWLDGEDHGMAADLLRKERYNAFNEQ